MAKLDFLVAHEFLSSLGARNIGIIVPSIMPIASEKPDVSLKCLLMLVLSWGPGHLTTSLNMEHSAITHRPVYFFTEPVDTARTRPIAEYDDKDPSWPSRCKATFNWIATSSCLLLP